MITHFEVPALIRSEIPSLSTVTHCGRATLEVYSSLHDLTDCARHSVEDHNLNLAKKCFILAEKLYRNGDRTVRMLIENIFIFSFSSFMPRDKVEQLVVRSTIPHVLYDIYLKQVMSTGC
jgi:hypothetical protein